MTEIAEWELNDIANEVGIDSNTLMNLGIGKFGLGLQKTVVDRFVASNRQDGNVTPNGTRNMLFAWKRNTSPREQRVKLRKALINAQLLEIADKYLPEGDDTDSDTDTVDIEFADEGYDDTDNDTETVDSESADEGYDLERSCELKCRSCDGYIAEITDVISKQSDNAVSSKVRDIMGKKCLVQLMKTVIVGTGKESRYDVIILTNAVVTLDEEVYPIAYFDGYKKHRPTWCKGCSKDSHQIGWYVESTDGSSAPFHAVFLQEVIHDTYDSDNTVNAFLVENRNED